MITSKMTTTAAAAPIMIAYPHTGKEVSPVLTTEPLDDEFPLALDTGVPGATGALDGDAGTTDGRADGVDVGAAVGVTVPAGVGVTVG